MMSWFGRPMLQRAKEKLTGKFWAPPHEKAIPSDDYARLAVEQTCPACLDHPVKLYEGPSGGMSTNVFCSNCGQGYNLTPMINSADRIGINMDYCDNEQIKARFALKQQFEPRTTFTQVQASFEAAVARRRDVR